MTSRQSFLAREPEKTLKLMRAALGEKASDLAVINTNVLNVYTGEVMENRTICIWDQWIAYVGEDPGNSIGPETEIIDAKGLTAIPGLIDGHMHMAWLARADAFLKQAMKGGTTTIITETLEPYPVAGLKGVIDFLGSLKDQPIKFFATAPVMVSTSGAARGVAPEDLRALLDRPDIVGLGETYWQALLQEPDQYLPALAETQLSGKTLEGHTAGASEKNLMAYLTAGVTSCHEPIKAAEVLDRLRLGMHVMVREGSIRRDLEEISQIKDTGADLRRLILVSDGIHPGELLEKGYMEYIVQKAIDLGFQPMEAVRMATLNVAEHFRMDHLLGAIAPGKYADLLLIPDIKTIRAEMVISNGKCIAKKQKLLMPPRIHTYKKSSRKTILLSRDLEPGAFVIPKPDLESKMDVRVISMVTDLVTKEKTVNMETRDGNLEADVSRDILKIAAVDRTLCPGKIFTGLIQGFGLKSGAMASSGSWDTTDIVVIGENDADMALAVNRIRRLQGGTVLCESGNIVAELPMPLFGIISDLSLEEIDHNLKDLNMHASRLGIPFRDPMLSLITLTGAAIPFFRICEEGLVDIKSGQTLGLFKVSRAS